MREADSEELRRQRMQDLRMQLLDDWLQQPTQDRVVRVPRRAGASTILHTTVRNCNGFHLENIYSGLEYIRSEVTAKRFLLGFITEEDRERFFPGVPCIETA